MMKTQRLLVAASVAALAFVSESCQDGLLHAPAPPGPATVTMRASLSRTAGFAPEAYDRANRVLVRFRIGDEIRFERDLLFTPSASQTIVPVDVPLHDATETMNAEIELRLGDRPLFRASTASAFSAGVSTQLDLTLEPVVAAVTCGTGVAQFTAYGQTTPLGGAALFATGDTIRGVSLDWSTSTGGVVNVDDEGQVTALQDGDVVVTCRVGDVTATRSVHVLANVASIQVAPLAATLVVGSTLPHVATLFDSRGNVITTPRPVTWSSASNTIATVNTTGVVTGVASGSARIDATSAGIVGSSTLTVVIPSSAVTIAATGVLGNAATLVGSVNPNGAATQAWFEYGTDQALTSPSTTAARVAGAGTGDVGISEAVAGLVPNTTYFFRMVASSTGGIVRGTTLSFTTPRPPSATTSSVDPTATQAYTGRGSVNPNARATTAWFEYGTSSTLSGALQTPKQSIGSGTTSVAITQSITGLQPFTTYFARVVASSTGGTTNGNILSFRTGGPPSLTNFGGFLPANTCGFAQASATGNPNGGTAEGWFEYGPTSSLGFATNHTALGSGTGGVVFSSGVTGVPVFFRAVASNAWGTSRTSVLSLTPSLCVR